MVLYKIRNDTAFVLLKNLSYQIFSLPDASHPGAEESPEKKTGIGCL
jgi:hypothetical protein